MGIESHSQAAASLVSVADADIVVVLDGRSSLAVVDAAGIGHTRWDMHAVDSALDDHLLLQQHAGEHTDAVVGEQEVRSRCALAAAAGLHMRLEEKKRGRLLAMLAVEEQNWPQVVNDSLVEVDPDQ